MFFERIFRRLMNRDGFKKAGSNSMECPGSFALERPGRHAIIYTEPGRRVDIEVEGGASLGVYLSQTRLWKLPDGVPLSAEDRIRIAANLARGLEFLGVSNEIL